MPPDFAWQIIVEGGALVFAAGGAWWTLRQLRADNKAMAKEIRALWQKHDRVRDQTESRYRKTLVTLTAMAAALPDNPGTRQRIMEMIQGMSETNGST